MELEVNATNFHKHKTGKDGFRNDCKKCFALKSKKYYSKNKDAIAIQGKVYRENNKDLISERGRKYREKNKEAFKVKYQEQKEYHKKQAAKYWEENKERLIEQNKEWKRNNRDKIVAYKKENRIKLNAQERTRRRTPEGKRKAQMIRNKYFSRRSLLREDFTLSEWESCLEHFDYTCAYCGGDEGTLEQDHFIALTKGGEYTKKNIVPACRSCNASKGNRDFYKWYKNRDSYSAERECTVIKYVKAEVEKDNDSLQVHGISNQQDTQNTNHRSG